MTIKLLIMKHNIILCFVVIVFLLMYSCISQDKSNASETLENIEKREINDQNYVLDKAYPVGDVRRYGLYPNKDNVKKHPKTKKYLIQSALDLAEESGVELYFPKGNYGINILIDSRSNLKFYFDSAEFSLIYITNEKGPRSENIIMKGKALVYNRFGTYESSNIKIDSLILKTDVTKSSEALRNKGCHIYKGTKNLEINYLEINDFGSGDEKYKNNHAALAIDGQRNNPEQIKINKTVIKSSDRHAAYITGSNHYFNEIIIEKYAQGNYELMTPMQDAQKEDSYVMSGLWLNRCNNSIFNKVKILTKESPIGFPLKLDEGDTAKPTVINHLELDVKYTDALVVDDVLTNVLVKKVTTLD